MHINRADGAFHVTLLEEQVIPNKAVRNEAPQQLPVTSKGLILRPVDEFLVLAGIDTTSAPRRCSAIFEHHDRVCTRPDLPPQRRDLPGVIMRLGSDPVAASGAAGCGQVAR
jgi:hypothetical protein